MPVRPALASSLLLVCIEFFGAKIMALVYKDASTTCYVAALFRVLFGRVSRSKENMGKYDGYCAVMHGHIVHTKELLTFDAWLGG
jgi:hypothetical protein